MRIMLTLVDREEISRGLAEDLLFAEIAVRIGRDPSVVSRDVARHGGRSGYRAVIADQTACAARERPKLLAVERSPRLRAVVCRQLRCGWSPTIMKTAHRNVSRASCNDGPDRCDTRNDLAGKRTEVIAPMTRRVTDYGGVGDESTRNWHSC